MKILLVHNNYGAYSGEEAVVDQQISLFTQMGHQVSVYRKTTEGARGSLLGNLSGLLSGFYAPKAVREMIRLMKSEDRPDVVVIHNLYPFISPAILKHIKRMGVPVIMTVHNFRLMCPTGLFMRDSQPCERCLRQSEWNCVRYNCEDSRLKSFGYAARSWYARITKAYINHVDKYACITKFQIQKLIEAGYAAEKMVHIPNFISQDIHAEVYPQGDYIAISGRISKEKGIDWALNLAGKTPDIKYVFAGLPREGEESIASVIPGNCTFLGHISDQQLQSFYQNARFLLNTSRCYEGFPMAILEAASYGKPAIGPGHAGFLEIIDHGVTGYHFRPGDENDLEKQVVALWNDAETCLKMGQNARKKLKEQYTATTLSRAWEALLLTTSYRAML